MRKRFTWCPEDKNEKKFGVHIRKKPVAFNLVLQDILRHEEQEVRVGTGIKKTGTKTEGGTRHRR